MKLCRDCKHCVMDWLSPRYDMCAHPKAERCAATGVLETHCRLARSMGFTSGFCRKAGNYWEERGPRWWEFWK